MDNLELSNHTAEDPEELLEKLESSRESAVEAVNEKAYRDLKIQLEDMVSEKDNADSVSRADIKYGPDGDRSSTGDEETGKLLDEIRAESEEETEEEKITEDTAAPEEALQKKESAKTREEELREEEHEDPASDEYVPGRAIRRRAVETIELFDEKPGMKSGRADKDGLMGKVQDSVSAYVAATDKEIMLSRDEASLDETSVDNALGRLAKLESACSEYMEKKDPILRSGKKRKDSVRFLKDQLESLKEEKDGFEDIYEEMYLPRPALKKEEDKDGEAAGDDDGRKKKEELSWDELDKGQQSFAKGVDAMGASAVLPFEINGDSDVISADSNAYKSFSELSAERRSDEVKLSNNAKMQLTIVKTIGFLFGIADWEQIVDPENILYNADSNEVKKVRISIVPGMFGDIPEKINEADGKHFAESLKGDPEGIKMLDSFLKQKISSVRMLENATGIRAATIYKRLLSIRHYLKDVLKS